MKAETQALITFEGDAQLAAEHLGITKQQVMLGYLQDEDDVGPLISKLMLLELYNLFWLMRDKTGEGLERLSGYEAVKALQFVTGAIAELQAGSKKAPEGGVTNNNLFLGGADEATYRLAARMGILPGQGAGESRGA